MLTSGDKFEVYVNTYILYNCETGVQLFLNYYSLYNIYT